MKGKAFIFSAPSGSGKTTIVHHLLKHNENLEFSISACTRDKRGRVEKNGKDYYFLSPDDFRARIANNEFIEWEEVYAGNFYGTLKSETERIRATGKHVIFDVDVKGGLNLKKYLGEDALAVFVRVPSVKILKARLSHRGTESADSLSARLYKATFELGFEDQFDVTLVNENLEDSLQNAQMMFENFIN